MAAAALAAFAAAAPAQKQENPGAVQAIVNQFYPQTLEEPAEAAGSNGEGSLRASAFVVYDAFLDGTPRTIIAAYSNGSDVALRVIRASDIRTFSVVHEAKNLRFDGSPECHMELVDVDLDGKQEVFLSLSRHEGPPQDWLFRWDGSQLTSFGPFSVEENGQTHSELTGASLIDLDHTGPLVLKAYSGPASPDPAVFRLSEGKFVFDKEFLFLETFSKDEDLPQTWDIPVYLEESPTAPHTLRIVNGARDGTRRVNRLRVVLNGVEVISPGHFNQKIEFLTVPISLQAENTIALTLAGTTRGHILISIDALAPVRRARQGEPRP